MERLTKTYSDGSHGVADNLPCGENSYQYKGLLLEALGKYEDLDEQGLLLWLPCKVGDTIWYVDEDDDEYPIELEIGTLEISKNDNDNEYTWYYAYNDDGDKYGFIDSDFGETVFFTKEEAEAKLKEMEKNQ